MKKCITVTLFLFCGLLLLPAFTAEGGGKLKIPKKVDAVFQAKCYGCHNNESKNNRPKDKLNWDTLPSLPADQQAEKLAAIQKVLEKGSMPPDRFLEKQPDKKLTDKETANMKKWAVKMAKRVSK
ncbi:MAG: heme-binding domain-containing protein [Saprospiraceae bacterium]|nr:heme-binding domain-containing protein [Lewinellaceae bacterium]